MHIELNLGHLGLVLQLPMGQQHFSHFFMSFPCLFQADIFRHRHLVDSDCVGLEVQGEEGAVSSELGPERHATLDRQGGLLALLGDPELVQAIFYIFL